MDITNIENSLFQGESVDVLKQFPENIIDCTITSPPYDNLRNYKDCEWNFEKFKEIATELYRVTKKGGVVVWVVGDAVIKGSESGSSFKQALYFIQLGFKLHDTMIFEKNTSSFPARRKGNRYTQIFEYMFVFSKDRKPNTATLICDKPNKWAGYTNWGKNTHRNKDGDLIETKNIKPVPDFSPRNNIWTFQVNNKFNTNDKEAHKHPAIFPEKLVKDHVLSWTKEGDLVLDPFAGSGTTLKVSDSLKRKFVGIERNGDYNKKIALPRLRKYIPNIELKIIEKVPEVVEELVEEQVEEQVEEPVYDEKVKFLKKKTLKELKKICRNIKIKGYSNKRKGKLIEFMLRRSCKDHIMKWTKDGVLDLQEFNN